MFADHTIIFYLFVIFLGAALLASLALAARQALIIGYIVVGVVCGPWGIGLVSDTGLIANIAQIGIIFLLFLLGLDLTPQKLWLLLKQTLLVTFMTSLVLGSVGWAIARYFGFTPAESVLVGVAAMFSSTIIGIKLLPTTALHHRHTGEVIISVLLLQDLIAILVLLGLQAVATGAVGAVQISTLVLALPALVVIAFLLERYVLLRLFQRFDQVEEYVFLLTLAWCLGIAQLAAFLGLSHEIGAFIGGIAVATSPIAQVIALRLKPLRDFFLVLFFFALGASLDLHVVGGVFLPAAVLAVVMLGLKPPVYRFALGRVSESPRLAWETGFRLGQMSEFSLLITFLAAQSIPVGQGVVTMIQLATILTFVGSSSIVVLNFPTPVAVTDRLRRD